MQKWLFSPLVAVVVGVVGIGIFLSLLNTDTELEKSAALVGQMRDEVAHLEQKVAQSTQNVIEATASGTKERIIRDELLLKKPGEYVVQLPNLEEQFGLNQTEQELAANSASTQNRKPIQEWKQLFSN